MERRLISKTKILGTLFLVASLRLSAMDRWEALSQLESGDDDHASGRSGEVSRYQIQLQIWRRFAGVNANWQNPADALAVAQKIMAQRCADFQRKFQRAPSDFEFYILWNAPSQIAAPGKAVSERARRFCNLLAAPEPEKNSSSNNIAKPPS